MTVGGLLEQDHPVRRTVPLAVIALLLLCAAGCGGGTNEGRPSLTASPTRSITQSPPSVSAPTRSATGLPTRSSDPTTAEAPTAEPTTAEPTPTAEADAATGAEGDNTTLLVALLVLLALAAGTVAFLMLRRGAVRRNWAAAFGTARRESERLARDVLPALVADSRESRRGGWAVARPGLLELEDRLAGLARSAPDEHLGADAAGLREALGQVRQSIDDELRASGIEADYALYAARKTVRRLDERLAAVTSPTARGSA